MCGCKQTTTTVTPKITSSPSTNQPKTSVKISK